MQTKQKSIENFINYMDELVASNYILSDKKLTDLMRSIATSKLFYTLFEYCSQDFNYEECFKDSFVRGDGYGKGRFILPKDPKVQIALIFSLLFQINTNEISFLNLLDNYFNGNSYNESYRNFAMQVLIPFRSEVLKVATAMAEDEDPILDVQEIKTTPTHQTIKEEDAKKITELLDQSRSVILQYKIEPALKGELVALYENFKNVLYEGIGEKIKIAYLGYKYATLYHRKQDKIMRQIETILISNGILTAK